MTNLPTGKRLPPTWLLGLMTFCNGSFAGISMVTIPQLLAAQRVPESQIAQVTSIAIMPGVFAFLLAPILDIRFSRRSYAIALALLQATAIAVSLNVLNNLSVLTACLVLCNTGYYLFTPAVAGWFGAIVDRSEETRLGSWLAAGGVAGFGVMSAAAITLLRSLPFHAGIIVVVLIPLFPLLILPSIPAPSADRRLAHDGFGQLARSLAKVLSQRHVLRLIVLFAFPAATFALTNTLGGLGRDFHASEGFVGLIGGLGATVGGVFGALVAPALARRLSPLVLYMAIGVAGAAFTLCLLAPARTPALFAAAMIGENIFQSAAFAVIYALVLLSTGKDNPLAATQFAFLTAAATVPLAYMQLIDGKAYGWKGLTGALMTDAAVSTSACLVMALLFSTLWRDSLTKNSISMIP